METIHVNHYSFYHRYRASVTGLELIMCAHYAQYKCCQVIHFALPVKIAAMCQLFKVKESVLIQQKVLSCTFKWHFNT